MRVLLFHPWGRFDPAYCSASHTAFAQLEFFQARGWDVHCVHQEIPAWGVSASDAEVMSRFACVKSVRTLRIDCEPIAPRDYGDEFRQLLYATERAARGRMFCEIAGEQWDAFFTTDVTCAPYAHALPRRTLKMLAVGDSYARRAAATELTSPHIRAVERKFTFARVECELYRLFDRVLFTSEAETREAACHGVKGALNVPPLIGNTTAIPREVRGEHDIVICGGSRSGELADAEWFYRHVYLPHLRAGGVGLTVAGPVAEQFAVLDQRVTKLSSTEGVYHAARVVIAPACEAAGPHVSVMNALAAGRAVVTTPPGIRGLEFGENAAVVVEMRNDPGCAAGVIRDLLAAGGWREVLGERGAEVATQHTPERHFAALEVAWQHPPAKHRQNVVERSREC